MRICDKCGRENADPQTDSDLWCEQCRGFLGFPVQSHAHERRVVVGLVDRHTSVVPGREAALTARVRNSGDVVEGVALTVEGRAADWTLIEPPEVALFPKQETEVRIVFRPPRASSVACGVTPFQLIATSRSDATVADVTDGTVDVGAFVEIKPSLTPLRSTGPSGAQHHLVLENAGNTVATLSIRGSQPGSDLVLAVKPESFELAPGANGEAEVDVRPRQTLYGAADKTHPFAIGVTAQGLAPITIQALHIQEAVTTAPTLVLDDTRLHAAPGQEVTTSVTIRNRGRGGDDYSLELLGPAGSWGRVIPPVVALPSAGEVAAKIAFTPPANPAAQASEIPFGIRCAARLDAKDSVVAEGVLEVEAVTEIGFKMDPERARGRWLSRHVMEIENRGNSTAELRPVIADPAHDLSFAISPPQVRIPGGGRDTVLVKVRPRRPKWLSKPSTLPFHVSVVPPKGSRERGDTRDVEFEQVPVFPRRLTVLVTFMALVAGVAGSALLMFGGQINQWF